MINGINESGDPMPQDTSTLGGKTIESNGTSYQCVQKIGLGNFGVVYKATDMTTGETVAIKRVLQDVRYKNRELQIMNCLDHPNVVRLKNSFYEEVKDEGTYLNLILEYMPKDLYQITQSFKPKGRMPIFFVKLYMYQMLRALAYIHSRGICHRDIKPHNILVNPETCELKLCDYGSAKILVADEANIAYICSRYYRAPELIFNATYYWMYIDIWSAGCVMAELLLGRPIFTGENGPGQLIEIFKVLGTPTGSQIAAMNPSYKNDIKLPQFSPTPWSKIFPNVAPEAFELLSQLLVYEPQGRINPLKACAHPFFDELRQPNVTLPNGNPLPDLFNFSPDEIAILGSMNLHHVLVPPHHIHP